MESGILGLEIRNTAEKSGNPLTSRIQNPSSIDAQWETLESGIHSVESRIQDGLEFPYIGWTKIWKFCPILTLATFGGKNVKSVKVISSNFSADLLMVSLSLWAVSKSVALSMDSSPSRATAISNSCILSKYRSCSLRRNTRMNHQFKLNNWKKRTVEPM